MARKQYPLRIDPAIWEAVQRWADDEMRSANGQVEWILRDALKRAGRLPKKEKPRNESEGQIDSLKPQAANRCTPPLESTSLSRGIFYISER